MDNILYSWSFSDKRDRSWLWYIIASAFALWLIIWWFFTHQYGMSFIIILICGLFFFTENNSDDDIKISINHLWININNAFYDYSAISSYSVVYRNKDAIFLRLHLNKKWIRNIDLTIDNNILTEINKVLPSFIKNSESTELTFTEKMIILLKL